MSDLIIVEGDIPTELKDAMELLQKAASGEPVSASDHTAIGEAFARYGMIGADGNPVAWGDATRDDIQAAKLRTVMRMKQAELGLVQMRKELESRRAN